MSEGYESIYSEYLFARPSFLEGVGRIVDFTNMLEKYNSSSSTKAADLRAIRADWNAVGSDIQQAIEQVNKKI
ncbi:hypothetical protein MNBD_CHLOROFLEXI01-1053 [hydrothermal vent metagenome]|uniref:Uncharacterized protein n=1 Tax=hydrothermal vent metagenome TaxID=652676 RepID=A0A3B0V0L3_9ZZZZ